jgi:hypothetical protein
MPRKGGWGSFSLIIIRDLAQTVNFLILTILKHLYRGLKTKKLRNILYVSGGSVLFSVVAEILNSQRQQRWGGIVFAAACVRSLSNQL